tara:strand:+ start:130 stop:456 length:327 start_codon:yes stop_codon:yes gene_type:complete
MDVEMRVSKRQLKRIIREEYSRLKRSGLLNEAMGLGNDMYVEQIMEELRDGDELSYMELSRALSPIIPGFDEAELGSAIDHALQRGMIQARMGRDGLGVFMVSPQYMM